MFADKLLELKLLDRFRAVAVLKKLKKAYLRQAEPVR
jgi:hypothetical protein